MPSTISSSSLPSHYTRVYHVDNTIQLAITRTCKQIHEEATPIYFARNTFILLNFHPCTWSRCGLENLYDFLHNIGQNKRRCIRSLRFTYNFHKRQDYKMAALAFKLLSECAQLRKLEIAVGWRTTMGTRKSQEDLRLAKGIQELQAVLRGLPNLELSVDDRYQLSRNAKWFYYNFEPQRLRELEQLLGAEVDKGLEA